MSLTRGYSWYTWAERRSSINAQMPPSKHDGSKWASVWCSHPCREAVCIPSPYGVCIISDLLFADDEANDKKFGCRHHACPVGHFVVCAATYCVCPVSLLMCPQWIQPCYLTDLAKKEGKLLRKDMKSLGCFGEAECCCGAHWNFVVPCVAECTYMVMVGEAMEVARDQDGHVSGVIKSILDHPPGPIVPPVSEWMGGR